MILRALLFLVGLGVIVLGLNVSLGGIATMGWQGSTDFFAITHQADFLRQDSHVRFLGGVFLGVGLIFVAGSYSLNHLRPALIAVTFLVFVGGIARFSILRADVLTDPGVVGSLIAELLLFPAIGLWIFRDLKKGAAAEDGR